MSQYVFDNAAPQAGQRFASLEAIYDPWTIRHLEATGIAPGWHCWEVGAGGGSIAAWLADRCGPAGYVLVTDLDPRYIAEHAAPGRAPAAIQRHDIARDPMPARSFALIHARLVLIHVPERELALARMAAALAPGGWLVIDDYDEMLFDLTYPTASPADAALFRKVPAAQSRLLAARAGEAALIWGRALDQRLRAVGLRDVSMEAYMVLRRGGSPGARLMQANFEQIRAEAVGAGLCTDDEVARVRARLDDPAFVVGAPPMFTAWGRRA
jgi:ubiquinone/menaquinone biosynthesis C-methylase UbiE